MNTIAKTAEIIILIFTNCGSLPKPKSGKTTAELLREVDEELYGGMG